MLLVAIAIATLFIGQDAATKLNTAAPTPAAYFEGSITILLVAGIIAVMVWGNER